MIYIRRGRGPWAHLFSIQYDERGRDLWVVEFSDGHTDVWPSWDASAGYEIRVQIEAPEDFWEESAGSLDSAPIPK